MAKPQRSNQSTTLLTHLSPMRRRSAAPQRSEQPRPVVVPPAPPTQRQAELENDLQVARDLQQGLMLQTVPRVPGWEMSAVSLPARELGGDLYDFLQLQGDIQGIMIGDVSGKGLPAALRMAVARTVFRAEARRAAAPGATLQAVNHTLIEEMPHGMVTMLYAQIDVHSGKITLANAGHNYLILLNQGIEEVELSGLPLGVTDQEHYTEGQVTLGYGDTALLYTDGVIEATNIAGEMFEFPRLQALLASVGPIKPRALMARILAEIRSWTHGLSQDDDITMVLLRRRLANLTEELYSIAADVVGPLTATELWTTLGLAENQRSTNEWLEVLRQLNELVSAQFGRGIAREVQGQLRPVIEEYRLIESLNAPQPQGDGL